MPIYYIQYSPCWQGFSHRFSGELHGGSSCRDGSRVVRQIGVCRDEVLWYQVSEEASPWGEAVTRSVTDEGETLHFQIALDKNICVFPSSAPSGHLPPRGKALCHPFLPDHLPRPGFSPFSVQQLQKAAVTTPLEASWHFFSG